MWLGVFTGERAITGTLTGDFGDGFGSGGITFITWAGLRILYVVEMESKCNKNSDTHSLGPRLSSSFS